jgi:hypothetical protein
MDALKAHHRRNIIVEKSRNSRSKMFNPELGTRDIAGWNQASLHVPLAPLREPPPFLEVLVETSFPMPLVLSRALQSRDKK